MPRPTLHSLYCASHIRNHLHTTFALGEATREETKNRVARKPREVAPISKQRGMGRFADVIHVNDLSHHAITTFIVMNKSMPSLLPAASQHVDSFATFFDELAGEFGLLPSAFTIYLRVPNMQQVAFIFGR